MNTVPTMKIPAWKSKSTNGFDHYAYLEKDKIFMLKKISLFEACNLCFSNNHNYDYEPSIVLFDHTDFNFYLVGRKINAELEMQDLLQCGYNSLSGTTELKDHKFEDAAIAIYNVFHEYIAQHKQHNENNA